MTEVTLAPGYHQALAAERRRAFRLWATTVIVLAFVASAGWYTGLLNLRRLGEGLPDLFALLGEMFPPDFTHVAGWLKPLRDTLMMSVAGTALAILLALPLAFCAARTTTVSPVLYHLARTLLSALRAIPELIMGIVFVAAVGFGGLPGVLALGLHSVGMVGKLFAEALEHADPAPVEAIRSTGASTFQTWCYGFVPQVMPQFVDIAVYRWEYNFRASTVLGAVGAGGIGFELIASLRIMQYREVLALIIVVFAMVMLVDAIGASLRKSAR